MITVFPLRHCKSPILVSFSLSHFEFHSDHSAGKVVVWLFCLQFLRLGDLRHKEWRHFSKFLVMCRVRLELKFQTVIPGAGTGVPVSLRHKLCCVDWNLFCSVSDPACLSAKPLGLMNSISSRFPEVPLAKPCAVCTGVTRGYIL